MVSESPVNDKVSLAATVHGTQLSKVYERDGQRFYGLYNVSFEIYPGEMIAILGRRNSGKPLFSISWAAWSSPTQVGCAFMVMILQTSRMPNVAGSPSTS